VSCEIVGVIQMVRNKTHCFSLNFVLTNLEVYTRSVIFVQLYYYQIFRCSVPWTELISAL
jgi:hypothetical protein